LDRSEEEVDEEEERDNTPSGEGTEPRAREEVVDKAAQTGE